MVYKNKKGYSRKSVRNPVTKRVETIYFGKEPVVETVDDLSNVCDELQEEFDRFFKVLKDKSTNSNLAKIVIEATDCYLQNASEVLVSDGMTDRVKIIHGFIKYLSDMGIYPDLVAPLKELESRWKNAKVDSIPEDIPKIKIKKTN
jgi:hypothetical protein